MMQKLASNKIEFANTLRGLAALSVLVSHYFGIFWLYRSAVVDFTYAPIVSEVLHPTPWYVHALHYVGFFNWGVFGVALFFLVSGFVIPFSLQKTTRKGFAVNRFFRIFPTYVAGFTITLLAIWFSTYYFQQQFPLPINRIVAHYFPGLHDFFYLNSIDGIIWTLDVEIKFYVICALSIYLFQQQSWKVFLIPIALSVAALGLNSELVKLSAVGGIKYQILSVYIMTTPYLIYMFIGVAFHYFYKHCLSKKHFICIVTALFLLVVLTIHTSIYNASLKNIWSYGVALLLFGIAFTNQAIFRSNKIVDYFADVSYPLYVVHGVAGYVLLTILLDQHVRSAIALLITIAAALGLATIIHKLIELPTQQFGKRMMKQINAKKILQDEKKFVLEVNQES